MSIPATRQEFKEYCLKKLGQEVTRVRVSDNQAEDRIDEAIKFWQDFNSDGTSRQMFAYQVTADDIANQYITLPANIIGAVSIFDVGGGMNAMDIFDIRYQIALNDLYTLTSVSMVPFYMAYQHIALLEQLLVGLKPIRYNRLQNIFYVDMNWNILVPGYYIVVDCYEVIDPTIYPSMWGDRMLQNYATALIKKQLGTNLKLFGNIQMPGGVTFNGQQIYNEAVQELAELEEKTRRDYQMPPMIEIG